MSNPLNLFITGGQTAAGREACRQAVKRGHTVTVLVHGSEAATHARADGALPTYSDITRAGELKSLFSMAQPNVVIHLAPQVMNEFPVKGTWEAHERVLAESALAVVEAAKASGVQFLVYTSFAALYGDTHGEWLDETGEGHGNPFFKVAKRAEQVILESGLNACILRAGFNYSADDSTTAGLMDQIRQGRAIYQGDSHSSFNWIHGADLASATILAAEQQPASERFNIVDDHPASVVEFAGSVAAGIGIPAPANSNPPLFMLDRVTSAGQRAMLATSAKLKNDKAKQMLGWSLKYPSHKAGLEHMLLERRAVQPQQV
jgi:2-alkyl-3-oxoalkanoate reductase